MAALRAATTRHRHTEYVQWNTNQPILTTSVPLRGGVSAQKRAFFVKQFVQVLLNRDN